jgi:hypothetical protein
MVLGPFYWGGKMGTFFNIADTPAGGFATQLSVKALETADEGLVEFKQLKKPVDWKGLIDQNFLDKQPVIGE